MAVSSISSHWKFQSTHPVRGATTCSAKTSDSKAFQSTHPVRGATRGGITLELGQRISIHAPREGCDLRHRNLGGGQSRFQSTHPVRGATQDGGRTQNAQQFQSTHPVRGATRGRCGADVGQRISIHAPREGCDLGNQQTMQLADIFQSTHPVRGATSYVETVLFGSIFQSTHPVRGATNHSHCP